MIEKTIDGYSLFYCPNTGKIFSNTKSKRKKIGEEIGWKSNYGYLGFRINGIAYSIHRIAWYCVFNEWPEHEIDHINGNRADNRIENLRHVTRTKNAQNTRKAHKDSKHGFLGVSLVQGKYWMSRIMVSGKIVYLGNYKTPEDAHNAYIAAKRKLHEGCVI